MINTIVSEIFIITSKTAINNKKRRLRIGEMMLPVCWGHENPWKSIIFHKNKDHCLILNKYHNKTPMNNHQESLKFPDIFFH